MTPMIPFDSWFATLAGSLVDRFGPGALAWLEALLIAADRRASQLTTIDPARAPPPSEGL